MAFSVNHGNGGFTPRRGRRFGGLSPNSEINVVPLVDVVLVLLIIFMITANVMEFGLDIQVPEVSRSNPPLWIFPSSGSPKPAKPISTDIPSTSTR